MPPRNPELPEGTDHIVNGASGSSGAAGTGGGTGSSTSRGSGGTARASSGGESGGGFVATSGGGATDKLVTQVREQVSSLRGQATDKLRGFADDGKGRATTLLDDVSEVFNDAARSIDDRLGEEYGRYAHQAADAIASFAGRIREKSVEDLLEDGRSAVRSSPAIAIAAAAVAGFALMRVIRTGLDDVGATGRSGGRKRRNADTNTGGGA